MDIKFNHVSYYYNAKSPEPTVGFKDLDFTIKEHSFTSIMGQTGSGKSTLIQQLNGLLIPTQGEIDIAGFKITPKTKRKNLQKLRSQVGMVFQFPENQLYEATVLKDIEVGPLNFGVPLAEAKKRAIAMLKLVGLDSDIAKRSPTELSGGQMRRVAIAGILVMHPQILVLDEPTAGLDPYAHREMMELFYRLHQEWQLTTIMVSHQMDDIAEYSDEVIWLDHGELRQMAPPREIFTNNNQLAMYPQTVEFYRQLQSQGFQLPQVPLTMAELITELKEKILGTSIE